MSECGNTFAGFKPNDLGSAVTKTRVVFDEVLNQYVRIRRV